MFDPYRKWLGIPEGTRPPTHYQLLGISPDERDTDVINAAVVRQSAYVRNFQAGKFSADATRLLNEIAAAKVCLLDPVKRARYDAQTASDERLLALPPSTAPNRPPSHPPPLKPAAAPAAVAPAAVARATVARATVARPVMVPARAARPSAPLPIALEPGGAQMLLAPTRRRSGMPPAWLWCVLFGAWIPIALLVFALFGTGGSDQSSQTAVSEVDASRADKDRADKDHIAKDPPPFEPQPAKPAQTTVVPAAVAPAQEPPPTPVRMATRPGVPPGQSASPPQPEAFRPPVVSFPKQPAHDDFDRAVARMKSDQAERLLRRDAQEGIRGSWPVLDGTPRICSSKPEKMVAAIARARPKDRHQRMFEHVFDQSVANSIPFVGDPSGGSAERAVADAGYLVGIECVPGDFRERCLGDILPIFSFEQPNVCDYGALARGGYAVGAMHVRSQTYVNAVKLLFMRITDEGGLDTNDSYASEWIGYSTMGREYVIGGDGTPVIGLYKRQGLIVNAVSLVMGDKP